MSWQSTVCTYGVQSHCSKVIVTKNSHARLRFAVHFCLYALEAVAPRDLTSNAKPAAALPHSPCDMLLATPVHYSCSDMTLVAG